METGQIAITLSKGQVVEIVKEWVSSKLMPGEYEIIQSEFNSYLSNDPALVKPDGSLDSSCDNFRVILKAVPKQVPLKTNLEM